MLFAVSELPLCWWPASQPERSELVIGGMAAETPEERKARLEALRLAAELSSAPDNENAGGESGAASDDAEPEEP